MLKTTEWGISLRSCLKQEEILVEERGVWFAIEMDKDCKKPIPLEWVFKVKVTKENGSNQNALF